jgi:ABC-type Fe3+ transport system permease subunit
MESLLQDLARDVQVNPEKVLLSICTAALCAYVLALLYRITYRGKKAYSRNFALSLVFMSVLVALVIALIGGSIARALGVWGAFSVIRYRLRVNDAVDLSYVLASVVVGLACGVGEIVEAAMATTFLVVLILIFHVSSMGLARPAGKADADAPGAAEDG